MAPGYSDKEVTSAFLTCVLYVKV